MVDDMKTEKEIEERIEEHKEDLVNVGKIDSYEALAYVQGMIESLKWVLK